MATRMRFPADRGQGGRHNGVSSLLPGRQSPIGARLSDHNRWGQMLSGFASHVAGARMCADVCGCVRGERRE
jgi:hypothetical protein